MRDIKFRSWHNKEMYNPFDLQDIANSENDYYSLGYDCIVMQFSGIKDKTGKEIFEGDIITVDNGLTKDPIITACKWEDAGFILADKAGGSWTRQLFNQPERLTVIGNIYQHPELLESVQK